MGACPARREMPADATSEELGSSVPSAPRMVGAEGILEPRCHTTPLRPLAFLRIRTPLVARVRGVPSRPSAPLVSTVGTVSQPRQRQRLCRSAHLLAVVGHDVVDAGVET